MFESRLHVTDMFSVSDVSSKVNVATHKVVQQHRATTLAARSIRHDFNSVDAFVHQGRHEEFEGERGPELF